MQQPNVPFGGKVVILGGDFRQILPTVVKGTRANIIDATITSSNLWPLFKVTHLTKNVRALQDPAYAEWLLSVGEGRANEPNSEELKVPREMLELHLQDLINHCFGQQYDKPDHDDAAILCPINDAVNNTNKQIAQSKLKDDPSARKYLAATNLINLNRNEQQQEDNDENRPEDPRPRFNEEYLNSHENASLPSHDLLVAPGINVMLIRNLSWWWFVQWHQIKDNTMSQQLAHL
ncbi:uncharacterized protein LOC117652055 [Thrips palmi]|uniref:ATP-dependent DNA helicase n=1 Tax=Thrips palmi TaxID=161013 RepID=A0A6P9A8G9_THRPL|nr:uncharacterized protein LOC117652055 [Thrips palmi]